ncbi:phosphotransferase [Burkholderia sp. Ac-20353]|uniref:phosphotransferase enzyme family protein n=1 Tax=Burkholderia sp. Ac-20353 TaxID=2703894 RepID=UPI00197B97D4|nr:phosphotransferase [Burkholderia sp. Ac-20353]MBN3786937.1 phosphotransferase [Burkholderia sp. Ac-20353]
MTARTDPDYRQFIRQLSDLARLALPRYGIESDARIDLLSHSENTVFKISDPRTLTRTVMRIHRPNYQTRNAIQTELDWMRALNEAGIGTPQAVPALDGSLLQEVTHATVGTRALAVFRWIDGDFPDEHHLDASQRYLGQLSARMHAQSKAWSRPAYFERIVWDDAGTIGPHAHWGRWQDAPGLTSVRRAVLARTETLLRERLDAFGRTPDRFGLIHADMRIANLLVDGDDTHVIDFDDCGIGWFLHDMASTLSFIEHRPGIERLMDAWAEGYCEAGSLSDAERDEFPTFLMQRRLQLLAWMGSHHETDLARSLGDGWVAATAELGANYLRRMG